MQEVDELKTLVVQSLESQGILSSLRAQIRANVYNIVDNKENQNKPQSKVTLLHESQPSVVMLDAILEYLQFYKLDYSTSVLANEGNLRDYSSRAELAKKLGVNATTNQPLLFQLVSHSKMEVAEKRPENNNNNNISRERV